MSGRQLSFALGSGREDFDRDVIRFQATDEHGPVVCAVTHEAIAHLTQLDEPRKAGLLERYNDVESVVHNIAGRKAIRGQFEEDGSVLVSQRDCLNIVGE